MNEEIRLLVDSLRRGQYEDPSEKIALLSAALREHQAEIPELLALLRAPLTFVTKRIDKLSSYMSVYIVGAYNSVRLAAAPLFHKR